MLGTPHPCLVLPIHAWYSTNHGDTLLLRALLRILAFANANRCLQSDGVPDSRLSVYVCMSMSGSVSLSVSLCVSLSISLSVYMSPLSLSSPPSPSLCISVHILVSLSLSSPGRTKRSSAAPSGRTLRSSIIGLGLILTGFLPRRCMRDATKPHATVAIRVGLSLTQP